MQARQFKPLQIGSVSVDRCVEFEGDFFPPARMFPLSTPEAVDAERSWMEPHFIKPKSDGGPVRLCDPHRQTCHSGGYLRR